MRRAAAIGVIAGALGAVGCAGASAGEGTASPSAPPSSVPVPVLSAPASRPLPDAFGALGLSGENKPNGLQYRLRQSIPASLPEFVPRAQGELELWIADPVPEGWLAFYRTPLGVAAAAPASANARFRALLFATDGSVRWELDLNRFLSRPDHLEIQDIRLQDGELYFNEACQSYAREAEFRCSALVRVDPVNAREVWRSRPLVSNDIFLVHGAVVIAGYGFTAEPDSLFLVSRRDGQILERAPLDSAHDYLEIQGERLVVVTTNRVHSFDLYPDQTVGGP